MTNLKEALKKNKLLTYIVRYFKFKKEYNYDLKYFINNFMNSSESKNKIEYNILLVCHSLEKGMFNKNIRPFGINKTKLLIELLKKYSLYNNYENEYSYILGISILKEYIKIYENNNWTSKFEYQYVYKFLKECKSVEEIELSNYIISKNDIMKKNKSNFEDLLKSRHSVRDFSSRKIKDEDIEKCIEMALLTPTACNRQMVHIRYIENDDKKNLIKKVGMGFSGFELDNTNIFLISFDMNFACFIGERNQGWFNSGLVSMNFVNALHSLGIGSCFVQFGNSFKEEEFVKKELGIPYNERIAVIVAAGYYKENNKVLRSPRKKINDVYEKIV